MADENADPQPVLTAAMLSTFAASVREATGERTLHPLRIIDECPVYPIYVSTKSLIWRRMFASSYKLRRRNRLHRARLARQYGKVTLRA